MRLQDHDVEMVIQKLGGTDDCTRDMGYEGLVDTMGEVLIKEELGSYQGDYLFLLKRGTSYGYLNFGYGSCSGCDSLEACDTDKEVTKLRDELYRGMQWFDSAEAALAWFTTHDWEGDYYGLERKPFVDKVVKYLAGK